MEGSEENVTQNPSAVARHATGGALLSLIGLLDATYLTVKHLEGAVVPCDLVSGCEKVLSSAYSEFAGVPIAAFGAAAYFTAFSLSVLVAFGRANLWKLFGIQSLLMASFSAWLVYLQASVIGAFCQFCLVSAATSMLLLTVFVSSLLKNALFRILLFAVVVGGMGFGAWSVLSIEKPSPVTQNIAAPPSSIASNGAEPANRKGADDAKVVLEEFLDYQCDACAKKRLVVDGVVSELGDGVALIVRNFPVGERPRAFSASLAAEAAGAQGRFWGMYEKIFNGQPDWSTSDDHRSYFIEYARELGLDTDRFRADMDSESMKLRVQADIGRGQSLGVSKTPSLFVNGVPLPFDQMTPEGLKAAIQNASAASAK